MRRRFLEIERYFIDLTHVDSNSDGFWDGEEVDAGMDSANPESRPAGRS